MSDFLWVKMPSKWIADDTFSVKFSSSELATDIAALKIYICLCINAKTVSKIHYPSDPTNAFFDKRPLPIMRDQLESRMTYDELAQSVSLSRALISRGIKKLALSELIELEGTTRKKIYVLVGSPHRRWCKMPKKDLMGSENIIKAFSSFSQRYQHEKDALKIFLYLLSIRTNANRFVDVSRGLIAEKTGTKLFDIDNAIGFLASIGLLDKIESKGYLKVTEYLEATEVDRLHRYWVKGCKTLNMKRGLAESDA